MCLAVPGRVVEWLERQPPFRRAALEFGGVRHEANMECVPEADLGDYVLVHAGVALRRIDPEEARRTFEMIEALGLDDDELGPAPAADSEGERMKYLDEYRDPEPCRKLLAEIRRTVTKRRTIMEVCGGQTHGLLRYGIDRELEGVVELIHGPGCPVCVTPLEAIDFAVGLSHEPDVIVATFGDMMRVPGSGESLLAARAAGGAVQLVYSPLDAVQLAKREPAKHVVFFAVGFETTAPTTALAVRQADELGLQNFSLLVSHVRVQPAMEMLVSSPHNTVEGFLAAGHVCTVAGYASYRTFCERFEMPVVVTGFEPVDLLAGIHECVRQLEHGEHEAVNRYERSVTPEGNTHALDLVDEIYEIRDRPWRGIGVVLGGGLGLREKWRHFDARERFERATAAVDEPPECRSGEVLTGRIKPPQCEAYGTKCTPESPLGAPMVSAEGACAAYFRYGGAARGAEVRAEGST